MEISFGSYFFLLISLKLQLGMLQKFDIPADDFWATLMKDANFARDYDINYNHDYVHQGAEEFEAFAFANARDQKFNTPFQQPQYQNNHNLAYDLPNDSREEIYVFLDKGRTRYLPMNEQDRIKTTHSGLHINGQDIVDSTNRNFNNIGWPKKHYQVGNKLGNDLESNPNYRNVKKRHNCPKKHDGDFRTAPKQRDNFRDFDYYDYERNPMGQQKPNCRKHRKGFQKNVHFDRSNNRKGNRKCKEKEPRKFEHGCTSRPTVVNVEQQTQQDCVSRQSEAKVITKNVATVEQQTVQVQSLAETEVLLGSPKVDITPTNDATVNTQSDPLGSAPEREPSFNKQNNVENEVIVGSASPSEKLPNNAQNELNNKELPLTDSPIIRIKIIKPNQKNNKNRLGPVEANEPAASTIETGLENNNAINPVTDFKETETELTEKSSMEPILNTTSKEDITKLTTEDVTEETELNQAEDLESATDLHIDEDLNSSEDRLYTYVTKLDGTALKSNDKKIKYMEPIAYETLLIEPKSNERTVKQKLGRNLISKPKRNVQLRALGSNRPPKPRRKKLKDTTTTSAATTTTTTTVTPILATVAESEGPKLPLSFGGDQQNVNVNHKSEKINPYPRPAQRIKQVDGKQMNDQQDSQVLGSSRFFTEDYSDPCELTPSKNPQRFEDAEDNYDQEEEDVVFSAPGDNGIELHSAELSNAQADCNDPNDITYENDQHIQQIVGTVTPAPRRQLNDPCIT